MKKRITLRCSGGNRETGFACLHGKWAGAPAGVAWIGTDRTYVKPPAPGRVKGDLGIRGEVYANTGQAWELARYAEPLFADPPITFEV